jgi:hypothetical protein
MLAPNAAAFERQTTPSLNRIQVFYVYSNNAIFIASSF